MLLHISALKIKAAFFAIRVFTKNMVDREIITSIDNTTINQMGSVQYPQLYRITKEVWQWREKRRFYIFTSYINTKDNFETDNVDKINTSRNEFQDTEWKLGDYPFEQIRHKFRLFDVDLLACSCNAKYPTYMIWLTDPDIDKYNIWVLVRLCLCLVGLNLKTPIMILFI